MPEFTESGRAGLSATVPEPPVDRLKLGADFAEPPAPPEPPAEAPQPPVPAPPKVHERTIDLGDGSGVQKFTADSAEALLDKLAEAQVHATRKIRELSRAKITPEKNVPKATLSEADILALKEGWNADPIASLNKWFESQVGMTPEAFRERNQRGEAEQAFLRKHKSDFYACPENATKINELLVKEELPFTARNLEYAFAQLQDELTVAPVVPSSPQAVPPELPPPPPPPMRAGVRDIPPPPVSIPASFGERPAVPSGIEGFSATELAEISKLPPAEMKARIEQEFRKQRGSVR